MFNSFIVVASYSTAVQELVRNVTMAEHTATMR